MKTKLNNEQRKAVYYGNGPLLVLAGPGTGKTTVINERAVHLIGNCRIPPEQILVVTFSRAAAKEMQQRFYLLAQKTGLSSGGIIFGTLHSIFLQILKDSQSYLGCRVAGRIQKQRLLTIGLEKRFPSSCDEETLLKQASNEISIVKNRFADISGYHSAFFEDTVFRQIFEDYNRGLRKEGLMDYDDILLSCYHCLKNDPKVRKKWQTRFRYILVDEFQDINLVQYEILKYLDPGKNLFAVGDDDQSIYGFRGADPDILHRFLKDYRHAGMITLKINYRSHPRIFTRALQLISVNRNRFEKPLRALARKEADEKNVAFRLDAYPSQYAELEAVALSITRLKEQGVCLSSVAVLFRNHPEAELFRQMLAAKALPAGTLSDTELLFSGFIAKDLLAYMKTASGTGSRNDLYRILNRPYRALSREILADECDMEALTACCEDNPRMQKRIRRFSEDLAVLSGCTPSAAIKYIRHAVGYETYLKELAKERQLDPGTFLRQLDALEEHAKGFSSVRKWAEEVEGDASGGSGYRKTENFPAADAVQVMTMHASKGLEFDTVFLPCLNKGILPHKNASGGKELAEERRLLYVAMTRAKNRLFLSYADSIRHKPAAPSVFLESIF